MQNIRGKLFLFCIIFECCFIVLLILYIGSLWNKTRKTRTSVTPIDRNMLQFPIDTPLQYYYELVPNTVKEDDFSYMRLSGVATHTINADGLNERKMYTVEKPKSIFRIVTVGDSFTEGAFVDTKNNYSEVLEDLLNTNVHCADYQSFEVINLGVAGYDMQYNLERYKRKGLKYNPDLIILWTDENDYVSHNEKYYALAHSWDPVVEAPEIIAMYQNQGDFAPEANAIWYKFNTLYTRTELVKEELIYLRNLLQLTRGNTIIFSLQRIPQDIRQSIFTMIRQYKRAYFFPEIPDSYDAFPDNHPSIEGHKQFAAFLYHKLLSIFFTDCVLR